MYAGVPNSRASSIVSQPPTSRRPRSLSRLPRGNAAERLVPVTMAGDYRVLRRKAGTGALLGDGTLAKNARECRGLWRSVRQTPLGQPYLGLRQSPHGSQAL